jgi:hypothetical protein
MQPAVVPDIGLGGVLRAEQDALGLACIFRRLGGVILQHGDSVGERRHHHGVLVIAQELHLIHREQPAGSAGMP